MLRKYLFFYFIALLILGCNSEISKTMPPPEQETPPASLGITGDEEDVKTETTPGTVLMGGGRDVDAAFAWMIEKSGGGDFVVIRATGTDAYNPYIFGLGDANSVETLKINSVDLANNNEVAQKIRNAEALLIAGGDQSDYLRFWKNTKTEDALNYLINEKKVPVGGTSAGCAILGQFSFSALNGTITSEEALKNPLHSNITLQESDFISIPFLKNVITDQHYLTRNREGRHIVFMARLAAEQEQAVRGIGVDEKTAVLINGSGIARITGQSSAVFLEQTNAENNPEKLAEDQPLTWNHNNQAVTAHEFEKDAGVQSQFDVKNWVALSDVDVSFWYVIEGELKTSSQ